MERAIILLPEMYSLEMHYVHDFDNVHDLDCDSEIYRKIHNALHILNAQSKHASLSTNLIFVSNHVVQ